MLSSTSASERDAHQRVVPRAPWRLILVLTAIINVAAWSRWEGYWRARDFERRQWQLSARASAVRLA
jgi:hypothetical protein